MRIAIFHNFLDNIGGAERVGLTLARELNADVYSTNIDQEKIVKMGFSDVKTISIGKVPVNPPFRQQIATQKFRRVNLKGKYDFFIIDGDWAWSAAVNNKPNLCYVHSPTRELWDLYEYTREKIPWYTRHFFDLWTSFNRRLVMKYSNNIKIMACNSENTRNRIKKYLGRDATVIHPPIETSKFHYVKNGDFWLSVNRLINHKRVDLQLKAFEKMPDERLVVVGCYESSDHWKEYKKYIEDIKPSNVELIHQVEFEKLVDLYANCKGFITTAHDEDFGMTPVEAMASGKPVIAPKEGGYVESIVDGETGFLIEEIDEGKIILAVRDLGENPESYKRACLNQAEKFTTEIFTGKIRNLINER